MPRPVTLRGPVDAAGHLSARLRQDAARVLALYAERDVEVEIRPRRRSVSANRFYHGVIVREAQRVLVEAGYTLTAAEVHEWLKRRHLPARVVDAPDGDLVTYGSTITDSTTFFDYIEAIRTDEALLAMGFHVEDPDGPVRGFRIDDLPA